MNAQEIIDLPTPELRPALKVAWEQIAVMEREAKQLALDVQAQKYLVQMERITRAAAQRGLVPYVRGLEEFDKWLQQRPELREPLRSILQELGLWEIKLGYDPDTDLTLSLVSPEHPAYVLGATVKDTFNDQQA